MQTLFRPIVNATKQAAEETGRELAPMKKKLADIDGALNRPADGQLQMGNKIVEIDDNERVLNVDGIKYDFTPGLRA